MYLTTLSIIPDGDEPLDKRIKKMIKANFSSDKYGVKTWREVKKPHLPIKDGTPYWITLVEVK